MPPRVPMITATLLLFALILGYAVTVILSLALTFAFHFAPNFIFSNARIQPRFKVVQELIWLVCCIAGGLAASLLSATSPWITALALIAVLNFMLWKNEAEARQRGYEHQIAITIVTAIGVAVGFAIHAH